MSSPKKYHIPGNEIKRLIPNMGACYASDHITMDGRPVGYMYRERPRDAVDSGWRFMSGYEAQSYIDDPAHLALYEVNTICNYSPDIIPFLQADPDVAFERNSLDVFEAVPFSSDD